MGKEGYSGQCAVATACPEATEAALRILRLGGNAIDAAVAAAWTLSVCEPSASGIGGQSTLLIRHQDGTFRVIDGHSYAPAAVSLQTVSPAQQRIGHCATTVPSTPATLAYAQARYGSLSLGDTLQPAIAVALNGYPLRPLQVRQTHAVTAQLRNNEAARKHFLPECRPPGERMTLRQPALARTLTHFAQHGVDDFYHGEMAHLIARDMRNHGGLLTEKDLSCCSVPVELPPLQTHYRGFTVVTAGPPAGGRHAHFALGELAEILAGRDPLDADAWYESIALATYAAFRNRETIALTGPAVALPLMVAEGPGDTTHLTVADGRGSVVALTQSIQSVFGAKVAQPELGFLYNNYLYTCPRDNSPEALGPRCRPRSNVAPTVVMQTSSSGEQPLLALGSAGSRRITSSVLQVISQVVDRGMAIEEAVSAPRIHARLSGNVWVERGAVTPRLTAMLRRHFDRIDVRKDCDFKLGCVQALHWTDSGLTAAADPRRDGTARTLRLFN